MSPRFSPTDFDLWPGGPVPVPPVACDDLEVDGNSVLLGISGITKPLPDEFFLREIFDVDPYDFYGCIEFMKTYGTICATDFQDFRRFPVEDMTLTIIRARRHLELVRLGRVDMYFESVLYREEILMHFQELQFLSRTWLALQTEDGLIELVDREMTSEQLEAMKLDLESAINLDRARELGHYNGSREQFVQMEALGRYERFRDSMDAGLSTFSVGLKSLTDRITTIYSATCLQIYNYMTEQSPVHRCANEKCGRPFVKQRGTALYGQYRTKGVKYCSPECGKNQNERDRRRRISVQQRAKD